MDSSSRWGQVITAIVVILIAGMGYTTLSNITALNDLRQVLSNLETFDIQSADISQPIPLTLGEGTSTPPPPSLSNGDTSAPTPEQSGSITLLYPTTSDTLIVSSVNPKVQIRLQSGGAELENVVLRLHVLTKVEGDNREALQPGLSSEPFTIVSLDAEPQNIVLEFDETDFPPSGSYEGWLSVTVDNGTPVSQKVTVEISRPAVEIQHRLSGTPDATITLRGVRPFRAVPLFSSYEPVWEEYELRLWEKNLQEVAYHAWSSELANPDNGQTGYLMPERPTGKTGSEPSVIDIQPTGIQHPGSYEGSLTILASDGGQSQTIKVTAQARDSLWWPFLVIVLGALVASFLLRFGATKTANSVPYQRMRIAATRTRLRGTAACATGQPNPACDRIEQMLKFAEYALRIGDLQEADARIKSANEEIEKLETASGQIEEHRREIESLEKKRGIRLPGFQETLNTARNHYRQGRLADMERVLRQSKENLDQKAVESRDLESAEWLETLDKAYGDKIRRIEYRASLGNPFEELGGACPVVYTNEVIEFRVKDKLAHEKFQWKVQWLRRYRNDEIVSLPPRKTETHRYEIDEDLPGEYPRLYRVTALGDGDKPPVAPFEFQMEYPYQIAIPSVLNAGESVRLEATPKLGYTPTPGETLALYVIQKGQQPGKVKGNKHRFRVRGRYRIAAKSGEKWTAATDLTVSASLMEVAEKRYFRTTLVAGIVWALAAGIAGLVYIQAKLPTFGSQLDYLLALAWGLGVSATVAPKENLINAIRKAMGLDEIPPASGETQKPGEGAGTSAEEIEVPNLREEGLTLKAAQDKYPDFTIEPLPGTKCDESNKITAQDLTAGKKVPKTPKPIIKVVCGEEPLDIVSSTPKENLIDAIRKAMGLEEIPPVSGEAQKPGEDAGTPKEEIEVPDLTIKVVCGGDAGTPKEEIEVPDLTIKVVCGEEPLGIVSSPGGCD